MRKDRSTATRNWVWMVFTLVVLLARAQPSRADADIYFDVHVRQTGSATLHAHVFQNPSPAASSGKTLLAIHGLTETGFTYGPFSQTLFADSTLKTRVKQVVALDLLGHGESSTPTGLPSPTTFGDLVIDDYVDSALQALDALSSRGYGASIVIGHSLGGLVVQGAQESLLANGSSLSAKGIHGAILIAPVPCSQSDYTPPSTGDISSFLVSGGALGTYLDLPPAVWRAAGDFTTHAGTIVANAPSEAVITANEYSGIEPLNVLLQLSAQIPRPGARQGAFAPRNGTLMALLSFSQDSLLQEPQQASLYTYLIGRQGALYRPIVADDAVHGMYISNPTGLIAALRDLRDVW